MTWNHGYNTDLGYTYGYYREQSPVWIDLCAAFHGSRPRGSAGEARRYLELGCGQGLNLCLIAALHPQAEFVGIDFNPHHIAHAQQLARAAGLANVRFLEGDFLQLAQDPTSLGVFDWVSAHGIPSWIAPSVHAALATLVGASLKPGGIYYTSYNTLPGWLSAMPIQHLLRLWQVREGLPSLTAIDQGRERLLALIEAKAAMAQALPALRARLEKFPQQAKNYLVQEYLHDNWVLFWFDEMHAALSPHKLEFLGSATAGEWYLPAMLPEAFKQALAAYPDPIERQVMLDVLVNQSFRRDLWVKGKDPLWPGEQRPRLLEARLVLLSLPPAPQAGEEAKRFAYQTAIGEVLGKPEVYAPLYEALQSGPKSIAELIEASGQNLPSTLQAVSLMLHAGHAAPFAPPKDTRPAQSAQSRPRRSCRARRTLQLSYRPRRRLCDHRERHPAPAARRLAPPQRPGQTGDAGRGARPNPRRARQRAQGWRTSRSPRWRPCALKPRRSPPSFSTTPCPPGSGWGWWPLEEDESMEHQALPSPYPDLASVGTERARGRAGRGRCLGPKISPSLPSRPLPCGPLDPVPGRPRAMIMITPSMRLLVATQPVDFRDEPETTPKGIFTSGIVSVWESRKIAILMTGRR
jgi:SAM-dependent methyltransferase